MPQAVVDVFKVIQVHQQQSAATLVKLRRRQGLFRAIGKQQAVGQAGQRIVVGQVRQLVLGILDCADIRKHRDVMADLVVVVANDTNRLPLRVDLAAFTPVPDLAAPLAQAVQGGKHVTIEIRPMTTGLEQIGSLAQHFVPSVTGNCNEGTVNVHDQAVAVRHQHSFAGAIEDGGGLAQALTIGAVLARPEKPGHPYSDQEDQRGADQHPGITVDQQPAKSIGGLIEETAQ